MQESVTAIAGAGKIYSAISKVMASVDPIAKNRQADKYKFRGIDDAYQALQKIMADCGVFSVPYVEAMERKQGSYKSGSAFEHVILTVRYTFYADDGSSVVARVIGEGMDSGDKASNKAMSVADKYALLQVFKIPTAEAKDPESDSHDVKAGGHRDIRAELRAAIPRSAVESQLPEEEVMPFEVSAETTVPSGQFKGLRFGDRPRSEWAVYAKHLTDKMAKGEIPSGSMESAKRLGALVETYLSRVIKSA